MGAKNHAQRQAFRNGNGKPHALRKDEHGHKDECRHKEYKAPEQHAQRSLRVLLGGLVITYDGNIHGKEYGRTCKQRQPACRYIIGSGA